MTERALTSEVADRCARDEGIAAYEAMRESGFPVCAPGEIDAEVVADLHQLGLNQTLTKARRRRPLEDIQHKQVGDVPA